MENQNPDPKNILCRVIDVNTSIQNSFKKFLETEGKTLDDFANLLREEMSQIELFVAGDGENTSQPSE